MPEDTDNGFTLAEKDAKRQAEIYGIGFVYTDEFGQHKSLDARKVRVYRPVAATAEEAWSEPGTQAP